MWQKKIKKKKVQFFLLFIIMLVTATIFSFCIGFVFHVNSYINTYYNDDRNSDIFINTSLESVDTSVEQWLQGNGDVESYKSVDGYALTCVIKTKEETFDPNFLYAYPISDYKDVPWGIHVSEGVRQEAPKQGELWVTSVFADLHDIKVGDEITIEGNTKLKLTVSAIVNTALNPSATLGIDYFFVNEQDQSLFEQFEYHYLVSIAITEDTDFQVFYSDMMDIIGSHIGGVIFTKYLFIQIASMIGSIIGGIGLFAAVLILVGALIIIRFILNNNLRSEFQQIGIYKATGFTNNEIKAIYIISYGSTVFVSAMIGAMLGGVGANAISGNVLRFIGEYSGNIGLLTLSGAVSVLLLFLITMVCLLFITRKIKKMSPVEALHSSSETYMATHSRTVLKDSANVFTDAVNDIFKNKKMNSISLIVLSIVFYLLILFVNINYSIEEINHNSNVWFGTPESTATVSGTLWNENGEHTVIQNLEQRDDIKNYIWGEMTSTAAVVLDSQKYDLANSNIGITVFNTYKDCGFVVKEGANPEQSDEVAVSQAILNESGLDIGDILELEINGKMREFHISGTYATKLNLGYNLRILAEAVDSEEVPYREKEIYVQLKSEEHFKDFQKELEHEFSQISVERQIPVTKDTVYTIQSIVNPVIIILVLAFLAFSLLNIMNLVIMNNLENRRNYGIMKAIGFTTAYIFVKQMIKIVILSGSGILIGTLLNLGLSGRLFAMALGGIDGLLVNINSSVGIVLSALLLIFITAGCCCMIITRVSPKELMGE